VLHVPVGAKAHSLDDLERAVNKPSTQSNAMQNVVGLGLVLLYSGFKARFPMGVGKIDHSRIGDRDLH
jgi:hypothetical protein